jgi:hypothetical protein
MTATRSTITIRIDAVIWSLERDDLQTAEILAENLRNGLKESPSPRWDALTAAKVREASGRGISLIRRGAQVLALKEFRKALRDWLQQVEQT